MTQPFYLDQDTEPGVPAPKLKASSACRHEQVSFDKPQAGLVRCVCLGCAHEWRQVRIQVMP